MATNLLWLGTNNEATKALGPEVRTFLNISNVENTALSTWTGSTNITTLGTIATGVWNGSVIAPQYLGTGTRDGTKVLHDNGTWANVSGGGISWLTISSANVNPAVTKTGYIMETGGTLRTVTLPASAPQGFSVVVNAHGGQVRIVSNGNVIDGVGSGNDLLMADGNTVSLVAKATGQLEILYGSTATMSVASGSGGIFDGGNATTTYTGAVKIDFGGAT